MVRSIRAYSKSGSPDNRSNTPATAHRLKRWSTLFLLPKSLGRSRQGRPVRTRRNTASMKSLLSRAVTPRSDAMPGNSAATFAHVLSSTTKSSRFTLIKTQPTRSLNHSLSRNASDNIERGSGARGGPAQHHAGTEGTIIAPAREGQEIRRRQGAGRIGRDLPTIRRRGCVSCCRGTGRTARLSRQPLPD